MYNFIHLWPNNFYKSPVVFEDLDLSTHASSAHTLSIESSITFHLQQNTIAETHRVMHAARRCLPFMFKCFFFTFIRVKMARIRRLLCITAHIT